MKRVIAMFSVICVILCSCLSSIPATADNSNKQSDLIVFVEEFMEKRARNEWLYEQNDLASFFVTPASSTISSTAAVFLDTIDYYRSFRLSNGTIRGDFTQSFTNESVQRVRDGYVVSLRETISFVIADGQELTTVLSEDYSLTVGGTSNHYYISDVGIASDTFYNRIKTTGFDKAALLDEHQALLASCVTTNTVADVAPTRSTTSSIAYNAAAAATYARIYAMNYNSNFPSYASQGGDCANFASQCIWAGFGGSNHSTAISERQYPMDSSGTYKWYPGTQSWAGVFSMVNYANGMNSSSSTEAGWLSNVNVVNQASQLPSMDYKGAVLMIPGRKTVQQPDGSTVSQIVDFGHAIVAISGTSYTNIRYCGHTANAFNALLSDYSDLSAGSRPVKVILPTQYRLYSTCTHSYSSIPSGSGLDSICNSCGESRLHFILSGAYDTTNGYTIISGYEAHSLKPYSIDVSIYTSSGSLIRSFPTQYNKNTFSFSHSFASPGLYTIRVEVTDCDGSLYYETTRSYYSSGRIF